MDLIDNFIRLKPTGKRSNRTIIFDDEAALIIRRWLKVREGINRREERALFLSQWGYRISRTDIYEVVTKAAARRSA